MMKIIGILLITLAFSVFALANAEPQPTPAKVPVKEAVDKGKVEGRTYSNKTFGFQITFPDTWLIPGDDFEANMKTKGFDLGIKAPDSLSPVDQAEMNKNLKRVNLIILVTAYRSNPSSDENAIMRISVEDLASNPQIKDAVDYCDAVQQMYSKMKLPADFTYSATKAEKLGSMQFGYLDTSNIGGKKRMYVTVRKRFAIMFTLSYSKDEDLTTMKRILEEGNFSIK